MAYLSGFILKASTTATRAEVNNDFISVVYLQLLQGLDLDIIIISYLYPYTQKQIVLTSISPCKD